MEVTWDEFFEICQAEKPTNFKPPNWDNVKSMLSEKLSIENDAALSEKLLELKSRYGKYIKARNSMTSAERSANVCKDVVLRTDDLNPKVMSDEKPPAKKRKSKSLDQLGERQLKNRIEELWKKVEEFADENDETSFRIVALLLKNCKDKRGRDFGEQIWQESSDESPSFTSNFISKDAALAIMVNCLLGRETYSKLKKILK